MENYNLLNSFFYKKKKITKKIPLLTEFVVAM